MSEELKTCPFCGGTPQIVTRNVEPQGDPWYGRKDETFVICDCGACLFDGAFHEGFWDAETRAMEAWNRRPPTIPADVGRRAMEALIELKQLLDIATCIGAVASPDANGPAGKALAAITELKQHLPAQEQGEKERI